MEEEALVFHLNDQSNLIHSTHSHFTQGIKDEKYTRRSGKRIQEEGD